MMPVLPYTIADLVIVALVVVLLIGFVVRK